MKKHSLLLIKLIAVVALVSSCTKTRQAALPEEAQSNVFAISEFGEPSETSQYVAHVKASDNDDAAKANSVLALDNEEKVRISAKDVTVPSRMKFMFENLPVSKLQNGDLPITFSVDKDYLTAYKVVKNLSDLSILEKSIAMTAKEVQLISKMSKSSTAQVKALSQAKKDAMVEKGEIKSGRKAGVLLIPMFKYKIEDYGVIARTKNELKEETSNLELKKTEWTQATHIQVSAKTDNRLDVGMGVDQAKALKQVYSESKIDNQLMSAQALQEQFSIGLKFLKDDAKVYTRLDADVMHVYEVTTISNLNENQLRLLKNKAGNEQILSCQDSSVAAYIKSNDKDCVIVLKADVPVSYKEAKLKEESESGSSSEGIVLEDIDRAKSVGLVEIKEGVAVKQADINGEAVLDPNSTIKLSDIKGEFFYRRTFESASNMFLGRTGTSGDMTIIRFELEDKRIVVRNQQSLITYTGQGPKDREELMSFPVKYIRMNTIDAKGNKLTIPVAEQTTKELAEYAQIDWTNNTVPDSNSPLAFYAGGDCFMANSSLKVTDTDMRLAKDGVLNYSLSGSYTVKPTNECVAVKDVNSAYWGGTYQFNFNVVERISFMKHKNPDSDKQFSNNISSMAQAAFNFGVFTLADKVTENGASAVANRDGSEKYLPIIHDFRNGRTIKYYIGGLNDPKVTDPERRQLMIDASKEVIAEWNKTLRYAFQGTSLHRDTDYVEIAVDEGDNTGHLGDLDRNYIWYQELEAENGLLGVAQPAANPRAGTIESANVIIYSGNTMNQVQALLKLTKISRDYEKLLEQAKTDAIEKAKKAKEEVSTGDQAQEKKAKESLSKTSPATAKRLMQQVDKISSNLDMAIGILQADHKEIKAALTNMKKTKNSSALKAVLTKDIFKKGTGGKKVAYPVNEDTFTKKLTELAVKMKASHYPYQYELELNKALIQFGGLDQTVVAALKKRSEMLDAALRFDDATKKRPGCFTYARNDINDEALSLDKDPHKNMMLNYRLAIKSTLSHELGHAFGLLHNFKASTDKENYEFPKEQRTGRNYSSIMDYIADIDMHYAGPGPYDAHALRAAYTGMVEVSAAALKSEELRAAVNISREGLVSIDDVLMLLQKKSLVHFTKDTVNQLGLLKYYEQCDDGGLGLSAMCAQFDSGGSATEIVTNLIADYNRGYVNRNYVYDKILFGWPQKSQIITRNITLFQHIRSFLDEAIYSEYLGNGITDAANAAVVKDQLNAARLGYNFFHELIRTPDAPGTSLIDIDKRLIATPYKYKNEKGEEAEDIKIIEARPIRDVNLDGTRDKMDTIGTAYDKIFAMMFLLQSTAVETTNDTAQSNISYLVFEQMYLNINEPAKSPTMDLISEILSNNLKTGFFAPSNSLDDLQLLRTSRKIPVSRTLSERTAIATVIGLEESKWSSYDPFAEMFKVSKATQANAPADRFNVAKAGQNRELSDTKVYYASQNAIGSDALVTTAARNELFNSQKEVLFTSIQLLTDADKLYMDPINKMIGEACEKDEEAPECKAAQAKKLADWLKEDPKLAEHKATADTLAAELVAKLTEMNKEGLAQPWDPLESTCRHASLSIL